MADPVVVEPNDIPLAPCVGEKVETEEHHDIFIKVEEVSQEAGSSEKPQEHVDGLSETASEPNLENKGGDREEKVHSDDDKPVGDTPGIGDQSHLEEGSQERSGEKSDTEGYSTENEDSSGERHSSNTESLTDYSSSEEEDTDDEGEQIEEKEGEEGEEEEVEEEEEEEEEDKEEEEGEVEVTNTDEGKQENKQKEEKDNTNEWDEEESRREKEEMIETRERGDGQEAEEQNSNPAFIPRRNAFWGHDDRWTDTPQDERRKPSNRKLWDRTTDRWQHDMYREEEQGPKTQQELQETERMLARRGGRPGRRRYQLQEFVPRGERRGRRGGGHGDSRQTGDSSEEEHRENKENKAPESRFGSDQRKFVEQRRRFDDSLEGGERIRGGFASQEGRKRWQNSQVDEEWPRLGYDQRRKADTRQNLRNGANYDDEVQDNNDRYSRRKDTGNGKWNSDRRQRHGDSRRRDDYREGINYHEGNRELRRREGHRGDAREERGERDIVFDEGGKTVDEKKGTRRRHQDNRQEKINQESGGFGSPRKDRNAQDTRDRRPKRGDIIPNTEVQANAVPSTSTHSYSRLRGRGRGRGQTQELKKPRKNAADFTREREELRKKEEQQKKHAEEENFEDAEGEEEDVIVEEDYEEGEDREENAENGEKEDVDENLNEVVEEDVQSESKQNGEEQKRPGQTLADKKIKQMVSTTQQNPASSQSIPASKPKRYSSQRQQRVTQQIPLPVHQQVVAPVGTMYTDQAFYDQMAYQGIYVPPGTPSSQSMPLMPQHPEVLIQDMSTTPGEQTEMTAGMAMSASGPQPMGALQHETLMHQQLAALHQGAVAAQQNMAPEGMPTQHVPQHGMSPQQQQQQVLAAHLQMQAQQGAPLVPVPQGNVVNHGINPQSSAGFVSNMNVQHPHYSGVQTFNGQPLMYNNSQFPVMNVGLNPFVSQQMYGLPFQGGGAFYPPSTALIGQQQQHQQQQQQQQSLEQSQQMQTRRRPTAAITIKSPQERV